MENKINSNEEDKKVLDINNIESFLIQSGYLTQKIWTKENSDFFDWNKANEILLGFEFNENISPTEAAVKYGDKIQWINKIFKNDTTIEEFHRLYNHYTSTNISFIKLINNFIMLEIILKNFYNIINKNSEQDINNLFNQQIIMNDIDINSSLHDKNIVGLKQKLESIYSKINKNPSFNGKDANSKLITIIFLLSMGSSFSVDQNIPQITNLMNLFTLYNKIYVNDINLSFILFLNVIICVNLCIYANKKKSHFKFLSYDNTNYSSYYYQDSKKKSNLDKNVNSEQSDDKKSYISLFFLDNDIIMYNGDSFLELIMFQNCLKIFSIYYLNKNQIKMTINLTIDTIIEILSFFDNVVINVNEYTIQNNINTNNNNSNNNIIKLRNLSLLSKHNINKCFSSFNFNELIINVTNFKEDNQIKEINAKYLELIQKSKKLYYQNSITILNHINKQNSIINNKNNIHIDNKNKNDDISADMIIKEFKALNYLLNYFHKNKDAKKKLQFYCFKFRYFKCSIFREGQKEIQIYFDYSSIKERILQRYLKDITNILSLIKQYEATINALNEFKLYNIVFRVCQTNFGSNFINFYFTIIIKKLVFFIQENKYNRITIYDSKLKTYEQNKNMLVYIKDSNIKQKSRINCLKEMFNESFFNNKLKVFNSYLKELVDDWDIIIIGEDIQYNNIIYSQDVNILFLNIVKEVNDNSVQNFMAGSSVIKMSMNIGMSVNPISQGDDKLNQAKNDLVNYEYLNILMYITNDEDFADKIMKFSEDLKNNTNCVLNNKITLICERYFFEEKIIMNSRIKEGSKQVFNCVDNYYLVCEAKKKDEILKYDLYITKKNISLANYLTQEMTNDCSKLIYSFISTLSSCIELILFIFKNKEIDPPAKFYYIQKIHKNYYLFDYKMSNIFIKKLKSYDSLLLLNAKKSIPLFCLLVDKDNNEFNAEHFLDLFLRLFLNLNKVIESNKLNETFFEKIHKNMFFQNYDIYKLIALSYDAFIGFNDIFINNNYLQISKDDKFEMCYIIPYDVESEQKKENFKKILDYKKNNKLIVKNINIYDYNLTNSFIFNNTNELKMNYQKAEFFINYHRSSNEIQNSIKNNLMYVYKKIKDKKIEKKNIKKIMKNIKELYFEKDGISLYSSNISNFEKLLIEFNTNQIKIKAVKLDHRAFHI